MVSMTVVSFPDQPTRYRTIVVPRRPLEPSQAAVSAGAEASYQFCGLDPEMWSFETPARTARWESDARSVLRAGMAVDAHLLASSGLRHLAGAITQARSSDEHPERSAAFDEVLALIRDIAAGAAS